MIPVCSDNKSTLHRDYLMLYKIICTGNLSLVEASQDMSVPPYISGPTNLTHLN